MGIKGDIGQQVSELFEELGSGAPTGDNGFRVKGDGPANARPAHDESLYYEYPPHLKGSPLINQPPSANPEGKHTGHVGRETGLRKTHNTARGTKENRGTNWPADLVHAAVAKADRRPLDAIFKPEKPTGRSR